MATDTTSIKTDPISSEMEYVQATRAFKKAPHKGENWTALQKAMERYRNDAYDRALAKLKAEYDK